MRTQLAGLGENFDAETNSYSAAGRAELRQAASAWERYLATDPDRADDRVASLMVQAYSALNEPAKAAQAQEIITVVRPSAATFSQLAVYAYAAKQTRLGDLSRQRALELTPRDQREALRGPARPGKDPGGGHAAGRRADPDADAGRELAVRPGRAWAARWPPRSVY